MVLVVGLAWLGWLPWLACLVDFQRFKSVLKGLEEAGIPYVINNTLVRGLVCGQRTV
jgi:hypothetical protein